MLRFYTLALSLTALLASPALAIDEAHKKKADDMAAKAVAYLKTTQDKATGGWSVPPEGSRQPHLPAITGLIVHGMLLGPKDQREDSSVALGLKYILNFQQPDGGIYDKILPSYNTSICLSALSRADLPQARDAILPAQAFLRRIQFSEDSDPTAGGGEAPRKLDKSHPFYGGVGYGKQGRPDLSNTQFMLQALEDSGVSPDDPAVRRALVFLQRLQMLDEVNDMPYADRSRQGGFVYSVAEDADSVDQRAGESKAPMTEETLDDGTNVSRLRAYGSMTYAGFKSYLYAALPRDDLRVRAALGWIRKNYTVQENPGVGVNGTYYYYVTFARALRAWGEPTLEVAVPTRDPDGKPATKPDKRDWSNDLIDRLAELQNPDGSFRALDKRWMEDNPDLITAYALLALRHAAP
ncbi:MAG: prenyltransferase/squalene oxidase repeat-containing protein [Phycisphaerales bacterium]